MSCYKEYECTKGDSASFGWNPQVAGSIVQGQVVPFNQVITNASKHCCDRAIELNQGTGEIFVKNEGVYLITLDANVTLGANEILTITDGNGKTLDILLDTDGSGTRILFVKNKSIIKVINTHVTPIPYTVGTDLSQSIVAITIVKVK
jgi:hypothetical protein